MKSVSEMSQPELGAYVQEHLRAAGIDVVLSGGAAAAIYSDGKYVSADLDMIATYSARRRDIAAAMRELGFDEEKARYFSHPETDEIVEFPPGPLSVGDDPITEITQIDYATGVLRVISPTDCVKDRLAAYYHWGDLQSLEQAVLVAASTSVDLKEVERWSSAEGAGSKFEAIRNRLDPHS